MEPYKLYSIVASTCKNGLVILSKVNEHMQFHSIYTPWKAAFEYLPGGRFKDGCSVTVSKSKNL